MIFQSPGDILLTVCGFKIYYYGIIMASACLIGVIVAYFIFKQYNPESDSEKIWDFAAYFLIAGFLGARLYYCALNPIYYFNNPLEILDFREGGLSIHGGIVAGIAAIIILAKTYKLPVLNTLDSFICGTALAQSIGRWGNFFNSEAFGSPTNLPWKLYIPLSQRPEQFVDYEYFHPTFLYESILNLCIFFILLTLIKKFGTKFPGLTTCSYLILYSCVRIFVESIRVDSALNIHGIQIAKIISVLLIVLGTIGLLTIIKKNFKQI